MTAQFTFRDRVFHLETHGALTEKEEVEAIHLMLGLTCKESARLRGVSPETVKAQRAAAKSKVEAHSQYEFIMVCVANGWLSPMEAVMFSLMPLCAVLAAPPMNPLDTQFHLAQARVRNRESGDESLGQKYAVAPLFDQPAPGSEDFYDIPTALREQINGRQSCLQQRENERMQACVEKARRRFYEGEAA